MDTQTRAWCGEREAVAVLYLDRQVDNDQPVFGKRESESPDLLRVGRSLPYSNLALFPRTFMIYGVDGSSMTQG